ncbi:MAG: thioredoxin-dependent thiol peroxidase [Micrococcales bacterium]
MTETRLETGSKAPAFKLANQDGVSVSLADFKGQKVVLYFYPAALTPGCTKEACDFNDALAPFKKAGYAVLGVSPDEIEKLAKFRKVEKLKFDLLSDESLKTHKAYGAYGMKKLYGREYEGVLRSTFVIDEKGKVAHALYNVKATGHVTMLRKLLEV